MAEQELKTVSTPPESITPPVTTPVVEPKPLANSKEIPTSIPREFPLGCRYVNLNLNQKDDQTMLDLLLDGTSDTEIDINGAQIPICKIVLVKLMSTGPNTVLAIIKAE